MALPAADDAALALGAQLVAGSLRGGLVAGIVWLVCRQFESIPAATRAGLWWLASLALLLPMLPVPPVAVPVLPSGAVVDAPTAPTTAARVGDSSAIRDTSAARRGGSSDPGPPTPLRVGVGDPPAAADWFALPQAYGRQWLGTIVMTAWLVVVGIQVVWLLACRYRLRAIVTRSQPAGDETLSLAVRLAHEVGVPSAPDVRLSAEIDGPQVVGLRRPSILLPAAVRLSTGELAMTLCHELAHIRRRDLALGWIPALAERLFFFHPLAHVTAREYLVAREAACDATVVRTLGVEPWEYARLLVRFGVTGAEPSLSAAGSSTSSSFLRRRLTMLERVSSTGVGTRAVWCAVAGVVVACLPLKLVARTEPVAPPSAVVRDLDNGTPGALEMSAAAAPASQEQKPVAAEGAARQDRKSAVRTSEPTSQSFARTIEQSNRRLAELEAERQKRLSRLQDELARRARRQAEQETARIELLLDAMKRAAETSAASSVDANAAMLDAIEAQARRLAEESKLRLEGPDLAAQLRTEMLSLQAQLAKLEEQRATLVAQQQALVAAQQRLSADVAKLTEVLKKLEAERAK
jgi:beta-lactamase regulating signal transducer with metallopeptidase domain